MSEPQRLAVMVPVSAEQAADGARLGDELAAALRRTPAEWAAVDRQRRKREAAELQAAEERHAAALARFDRKLTQVLDLHGPKDGSLGVVCRGCEFSGYDAEPPAWPCETWALIAEEGP